MEMVNNYAFSDKENKFTYFVANEYYRYLTEMKGYKFENPKVDVVKPMQRLFKYFLYYGISLDVADIPDTDGFYYLKDGYSFALMYGLVENGESMRLHELRRHADAINSRIKWRTKICQESQMESTLKVQTA